MPKVEIYTTMFCPFCHQAKKLLKNKFVDFIEYDVSSDAEGRTKMTERSGGGTSVPQIFIDDKHVGGCDDIYELDMDGELNTLLGIAD
ncbi:MAG: glutaredoxin 3 [Rhodospirillales bacterium]|nr:glutaredoxin 3 [Rhodospirillales bacterium]